MKICKEPKVQDFFRTFRTLLDILLALLPRDIQGVQIPIGHVSNQSPVRNFLTHAIEGSRLRFCQTFVSQGVSGAALQVSHEPFSHARLGVWQTDHQVDTVRVLALVHVPPSTLGHQVRESKHIEAA